MSALSLDFAADFYTRYPGEAVTLWARVEALAPAAGFTLQLGLPEGLTLDEAAGPANGGLMEFAQAEGARYVLWTVARPVQAGERLEYRAAGLVAPTAVDVQLECTAVLQPAGEPALPAPGLLLTVAAQGRYLRYLPAVYQENADFLGRFLMLFESFWKPTFERLDALPYYFDARTAPPDLLPWLAAWVNLTLDERWPEAKRRQLLAAAVPLYRRRGTKAGLLDYLEIYTGVRPRIQEQAGQNFQLGGGARLGPDLALGRGNQPHTFRVSLTLPAEPDPRLAQERQRIIEAIIAAEKPAHTAYTLELLATPAASD